MNIIKKCWFIFFFRDESGEVANVFEKFFSGEKNNKEKYVIFSICIQNNFLYFRTRRNRSVFTKNQLMRLEYQFNQTPFISKMTKSFLSLSLNLDETTIKIWFQNRRAKQKHLKTKLADPKRQMLELFRLVCLYYFIVFF